MEEDTAWWELMAGVGAIQLGATEIFGYGFENPGG